jgi:REP element-mobilizing transposase RayT
LFAEQLNFLAKVEASYSHLGELLLPADTFDLPNRAAVEVSIHQTHLGEASHVVAAPLLKEKTFWNDRYFTCSTDDTSAHTIRKYIEK